MNRDRLTISMLCSLLLVEAVAWLLVWVGLELLGLGVMFVGGVAVLVLVALADRKTQDRGRRGD